MDLFDDIELVAVLFTLHAARETAKKVNRRIGYLPVHLLNEKRLNSCVNSKSCLCFIGESRKCFSNVIG